MDHTRFDPPIRPFEGRIITKKANFFFSKSLLFLRADLSKVEAEEPTDFRKNSLFFSQEKKII
jgi:hypothetical protein